MKGNLKTDVLKVLATMEDISNDLIADTAEGMRKYDSLVADREKVGMAEGLQRFAEVTQIVKDIDERQEFQRRLTQMISILRDLTKQNG